MPHWRDDRNSTDDLDTEISIVDNAEDDLASVSAPPVRARSRLSTTRRSSKESSSSSPAGVRRISREVDDDLALLDTLVAGHVVSSQPARTVLLRDIGRTGSLPDLTHLDLSTRHPTPKSMGNRLTATADDAAAGNTPPMVTRRIASLPTRSDRASIGSIGSERASIGGDSVWSQAASARTSAGAASCASCASCRNSSTLMSPTASSAAESHMFSPTLPTPSPPAPTRLALGVPAALSSVGLGDISLGEISLGPIGGSSQPGDPSVAVERATPSSALGDTPALATTPTVEPTEETLQRHIVGSEHGSGGLPRLAEPSYVSSDRIGGSEDVDDEILRVDAEASEQRASPLRRLRPLVQGAADLDGAAAPVTISKWSPVIQRAAPSDAPGDVAGGGLGSSSSSSGGDAAGHHRAPADKTFDAHQQTAYAKRILELTETGDSSFLEQCQRFLRGDRRATLFGELAKEVPRAVTRLASKVSNGGRASSARHDSWASCALPAAFAPAGPDGAGGVGGEASRKPSLTGSSRGSLSGVATSVHGAGFESYQYEEDESRVHFELRTKLAHSASRQLTVLWTSMTIVCLIGAILGAIAAGIVFCEQILVTGRASLVDLAFYGGDPCGPNSEVLQARDSTTAIVSAYLTYALTNTLFIFCAAMATYLAPLAASSGLPPLKAFLNGVNVPELLSSATLVAKVVGVTLVVSTGLPLGREGPMVHTGAIVAARVTRAKLTLGRWRYVTPLETRVPSAQRNWVGVGCAAGVAAAFNAPLGGILYSFEEVTSHWNEKMTWRSFFCVVVAALVYNALLAAITSANSILLNSGLVLNLGSPGERADIELVEFAAFAVIGILGGLLGGIYVTGVVSVNGLRRRLMGSNRRLKVAEATLVAFTAFTILFFFPLAFGCEPCVAGTSVNGVQCIPPATVNGSTVFLPPSCATSGSGSGSGSGAGAPSDSDTGGRRRGLLGLTLPSMGRHGRRLGAGASSVSYVQWQCPPHHYNSMASLLHTGQEGLILHLLERRDAPTTSGCDGGGSVSYASDAPIDHTFDWDVLLPFLAMYLVMAISVFGIFVPAGNFIPALTIGCGMGRLVGISLTHMGLDVDPGFYALMGAAAVLGGVTRMTLTLGVILVEVTDDAAGLLPMMFVLAFAKTFGDAFSPSFDHAMMHLLELPFLDEEPPPEFDVLTARDVMARSVVVLREVERVGDLVAVLKRTRHNGFPVVDVGKHQRCTFFAGLILRRQLLVLLRERVWELQGRGEWLSQAARDRFVDSTFTTQKLSTLQLTSADLEKRIDLRPFMDPSPYVVNELMPLRRVYRFFNEIGVRHLTVIDCREQVVGIITRKDIMPEAIEERILDEENLAEVKQLLKTAEGPRRKSVLQTLFDSRSNPSAPAMPPPVMERQESSAAGVWEQSRCQTRRQLASAAPTVRVQLDNGVLRGRRGSSPSGRDSPTMSNSPAALREVSMASCTSEMDDR